jgi:hypothetical protein
MSQPSRVLRFFLSGLYGISGVWLLAYCIPLFDISGEPMPAFFSWAWSRAVLSICRPLVAAVWIGMRATILYGSRGQIYWDILAALFYLLVAAMLLFRPASGLILAFAASALSAMILISQIFLILASPDGNTLTRKLFIVGPFVAATAGYIALAYFLKRCLRPLRAAC